jgi:TolB protein
MLPVSNIVNLERPHRLRSVTRRLSRLSVRFVVLVLFMAAMASNAHSKIEIPLDDPNLARLPVAIPDFVSDEPGQVSGRELAQIIRNDLFLTGLFHILDTPPLRAGPINGQPNFQGWTHMGAQALILGKFRVKGDRLTIEVRLYDTALQRLELGKRYSGKLRDHRRMVHKFGDRVMERLTGILGCFSTSIAFVGASKPKELFVMDFDGYNLRRITQTGSINMSPDWAPDGRSLLFTSYLRSNPDLWSIDLATLSQSPISTRRGINASARYAPDGTKIALSLSAKGIPKIFVINPQGIIIKRLTNGRGNDISPTWSPDSSTIAYVSDQAGSPQIYMMPVSGGRPRRLTFESNYNTDPDWSPRGDLIAFTARIEGRFQVCTIRTDGSDFRVLTREGSNQTPAWSPDGRMIAFSSNRDGVYRIYIMDAEGGIQVPISARSGKAPAWSRQSW